MDLEKKDFKEIELNAMLLMNGRKDERNLGYVEEYWEDKKIVL